MQRKNPIAITVDVEDAVNQAMRNFFNTDIKPTIRVVDNTLRLLDLFNEFNIKATFFILGEVADTYPELIKEIALQEHELGIHGYSHIRYFRMSREEIRAEISRSIQTIENISGRKVIGHRAPEFSINKANLWVLEVLLDEGIKYDSSIFPIKSLRYGWPGFNKDIDWLTLANGRRIIEAPLSIVNYLGMDLPVSGGGYMRVLPYSFTRMALNKILDQRPVIIYLHPYEIDLPPFQKFYMDRVHTSSLQQKLKLKAYWFNRRSVVPKIRRLLETYTFDTLQNIISNSLNIQFQN